MVNQTRKYTHIDPDLVIKIIAELKASNPSIQDKTVQSYLREFNNLLDFTKIEPAEITYEHCNAYLDYVKTHSKVATSERKYSQLNRVLFILVDLDHIVMNPLTLIEKPRATRDIAINKIITYSDLDKLIGYFNKISVRDNAWFLVKLYSLQKIDKVLSLKLKHFVLDNDDKGYLIISDSFNISLPGKVTQVLLQHIKEAHITSAEDFLFPGQASGNHFTRVAAWKIFKTACKEAGTSELYKLRDMRHTGVKLLSENGTPEEIIDLMLDYKNPGSLRAYDSIIKTRSINVGDLMYIQLKESDDNE